MQKSLFDNANMDANTYTYESCPYILWHSVALFLCSINRQPGAWHELAALFASNMGSINRDIHRYWGEVFFMETSFS
jgi:hypothetical protein